MVIMIMVMIPSYKKECYFKIDDGGFEFELHFQIKFNFTISTWTTFFPIKLNWIVSFPSTQQPNIISTKNITTNFLNNLTWLS